MVVRVVDTDTQKPFLLHIEIQNDNDKTMPYRMARYRTDIRLAYPNDPLRQYLIYIGSATLNMPDNIEEPDFFFRYTIFDMRQINCQNLLRQKTPDAWVLAILCDFKGHSAQQIATEILQRLQNHFGENLARYREYVDILERLSENRKLKSIIKETQEMITRIDRTKLPSYQIGWEDAMKEGKIRWTQEGKHQGLKEGKNQGIMQGKLDLAKNLLGLLDDEVIAEKAGLTLAQVQALK